MKRIISTLFLLLMICLPLQVKALSVSKNNVTIEKGKSNTIDLYAEVDTEIKELTFTLVYTSYDVPAYFNIESGLKDEVSGINHKIVFSAPVAGKIKLGTIKINVVNNPKATTSSINLHSAKAITATGDIINLDSQMINVVINKTTEEPTVKTEENKNLLEKIESEIVKIDLTKDVYEYTIKIKEEIEELDLKPIVKDEKYKVEISSQKISELTDNTIIIKVSDSTNTEEYKIKVNIIEEKEEIVIDEEEFKSTFKYKGKWVTLIIIFSIMLVASFFLNKKQ